jgi:hypothetical protein
MGRALNSNFFYQGRKAPYPLRMEFMAPEPERLRVRARLSLGSSEALDACAPTGLPAECTRTRGISCSLEAAQVCWRRGSHWSSFRALWRSRLRQDPAVRHLAGNIQQSSGLREIYSKCCNPLDPPIRTPPLSGVCSSSSPRSSPSNTAASTAAPSTFALVRSCLHCAADPIPRMHLNHPHRPCTRARRTLQHH